MDFSQLKQDLRELIMEPDYIIALGMLALKIAFIIILAGIVIKIGKALISRFFKIQSHTKMRPTERRQQTLQKLLENALTYIVYFTAILAILSEFNVNVNAILASAGVLGLAVGFGAQSLVKDIISGFFIIFEDQFSVGDYVIIGTSEGTVMEIGLRTTKVEGIGGEVYILPNGNVTEVINYSINNSIAILDINVAYENNIDQVEHLLETFIAEMPYRYDELIEPPILAGVQDLNSTDIVFRVTAKTLPAMQWAFARSFRKDLKLFLDEHHIHMPYPKMITYQNTVEEE